MNIDKLDRQHIFLWWDEHSRVKGIFVATFMVINPQITMSIVAYEVSYPSVVYG